MSIDMTNEELATEARISGRLRNDRELMMLGMMLQRAVNAEEDSREIAAQIISRLGW